MSSELEQFKFEISLSVLNHLGRNLYRNFITVLGEAISNAWDADATNVWVEIDRINDTFSIKDDGTGMDANDFQNKFLKIGYSKRKAGVTASARNRPYIGAKGIGKLALLSCANRVSIFSKKQGGSYVGGIIDNSGLDAAITSDVAADQYSLEPLDLKKIEKLKTGHERGTIIVFDGLKESLKSSSPHLRKLLALSFKFALLDKEFTLFVDGKPVTDNDLKDLSEATEFLWSINEYEDPFTQKLPNLKAEVKHLTAGLSIQGYVATVSVPSKLKIAGTEERATIDLFVNGRLREKNILRHVPTQRIVENYLYGQIHFNGLDRPGIDPFTSSREGVIEDDRLFESLLDYIKRDLLVKVLDQWDELRLDRGEEGDDLNKRKSKKERKAIDLLSAAQAEFIPLSGKDSIDLVESWLQELRADATFNIQAYVDCFLSENLLRKFITHKKLTISNDAMKDADKWKERENQNKLKANISYSIRREDGNLFYLDMDQLAIIAEGGKRNTIGSSFWLDAIRYKPSRNAVGHTGLLSQTAKNDLNLLHENIKARLKGIILKNP